MTPYPVMKYRMFNVQCPILKRGRWRVLKASAGTTSEFDIRHSTFNTDRSVRAIRPRRATRHARIRGVILIITLLGLLLLAALVLYVLNHGAQVNARIVAQHSADSAAVAGATWVARSFNAVAMNNVAMTRCLALINVLDSFPPATKATRLEQTSLRDALAGRYGTINTGDARLSRIVVDEFQRLLDELGDEAAVVEPMDDFFSNTYDVARMTLWDSGHIWRALRSLDNLNVGVMENLGDLARLTAVRGGEINLAADRAEGAAALMVPLHPQVPWRRGEFNDFERPVRFGLLPGEDRRLSTHPRPTRLGQVDDRITNRGPYDTVFGWRNYISQPTVGGGPVEPPSVTGVQGGGPNPFGGGPNNRGGRGGGTGRVAYGTYGTQRWMLQRVNGFADSKLWFSRFYGWTAALAKTKLEYVWPGKALRRFAQPEWDIRYPADGEIDRDRSEPVPFSETAWFRLDIKSRYPRSHTLFLSDGSWVFEDRAETSNRCRARVSRRAGWWLDALEVGPRLFEPEELEAYVPEIYIRRVGEQSWLYEYAYQVMYDNEIGIEAEFDANDNPVLQDAYFLQVVVYGGGNRHPLPAGGYGPDRTGEADDEIVFNPYDGFDPAADDAPAPVDFDHARIGPDPDDRRTHLTFLGLARRSDRSLRGRGGPSVQGRFTGNKPYPYIVALAEAQVFNNHSWDLWTQMWHAQLQRVGPYDQWLETIDASLADADELESVSADDLEGLYEYLSSIEDLAAIMLSH